MCAQKGSRGNGNNLDCVLLLDQEAPMEVSSLLYSTLLYSTLLYSTLLYSIGGEKRRKVAHAHGKGAAIDVTTTSAIDIIQEQVLTDTLM